MSETFDLNLSGVMTDTVSITDYKMVSPDVARVMISFTGKQTPSKISASIADITGNQASVIENSFRLVSDSAAVGFIRSNREIRALSKKEITAGYKSASANILMSNEDDSLWEVKSVGGSTYLARQDTENLEDLVTAVANYKTINAPKLQTLASVMPSRNELVAFVADTGNVDYGFVTSTGVNKVKLVASSTKKPVIASTDRIISSYEVEIDAKTNNAVRRKLTHQVRAAAKTDEEIKSTMTDYYIALYSYDPEYLEKVINQINETSFA